MNYRNRKRNCANQVEYPLISLNEKILKDCYKLYVDETKGLIRIAETVNIKLSAPRKKIIVLLIGNHSVGKSTFINWYIDDNVQKTGVAIETQAFTLITSGKKRESLTDLATFQIYPYFNPLLNVAGISDHVFTEISTSKEKKFSLITFIDTPGLVDGEMTYPYNVNDSLFILGDLADLILVFFDPIGQALCRRTLFIIEKLVTKFPDRVHFYLSKSDEIGTQADRQKLLKNCVNVLV